ncbi:helix-turn-helix transcriptional regulator [Ramlibacter sp. WS9]|uniref:ArsR/SmtB family transcription factor n=1 Tax=Ramlibacter sp. WS9 TaxID=1882741 RepID=UPI0011433243|nr:metalloregulator ArsR/SmtB family transcription factor [Ramlibacter sp. WS9]ROZ76989.1 transcriptional regulator [Ramlibacter sp. WS9]
MELTLNVVHESEAVRALAALAQVQRLRAFRALIAAGPEGTTPGALSEQLGIGGSGLSFHLKELAHAGLVSSEPRGRNLIYRANFERMNGLLAYLTEHCCQGQACGLNEPSGCSPC